jgi:hypothetical protein
VGGKVLAGPHFGHCLIRRVNRVSRGAANSPEARGPDDGNLSVLQQLWKSANRKKGRKAVSLQKLETPTLSGIGLNFPCDSAWPRVTGLALGDVRFGSKADIRPR